MKRTFPIFLITCLCVFLFNGCMRFALSLSPSLFPNFAASIFEECDAELARTAIPANLKLMEGLLKNDPENRRILTSLSMGFAGYSLLFVEADDPERASELYLRAIDYGLGALGDAGATLRNRETGKEDIQKALRLFDKNDLEPLFWTTLAWNAWINLNLDKPAALAQLSVSQACLERVLEMDAAYLHGLPHVLMGVGLAAQSPLFGGDPKKARIHFEEAIELSDRKFFLVQYYFARYYAVRVQAKELFLDLLEEIIDGNPKELKDVCLINRIMQREARNLKKQVDELFL
ncbi:MAG: TRAP transporter TatT component family protein [Desulfobacteraceae bacterium]